jgi:hypothetical protein
MNPRIAYLMVKSELQHHGWKAALSAFLVRFIFSQIIVNVFLLAFVGAGTPALWIITVLINATISAYFTYTRDLLAR